MTRVLALDPGDKVGWARTTVAEDGTWTEFRHGITPLRDMVMAVFRAFEITSGESWNLDAYDVIVCEDWRLYPTQAKTMIGSSFPSVQFIGAVRAACWLTGTKLVTQGAGIKKTADKTMKALRPELHELVTRPIAHDDGHDLDAIRHLWFHTFKQFPVTKGA